MDRTLHDILAEGDAIHDHVDKYAIGLKPQNLEAQLLVLQKLIRSIQGVSRRLADVSNLVNRVLRVKKSDQKDSTPIKAIETYPTSEDHAILRAQYAPVTRPLTDRTFVPVRVVQRSADLPTASLYYVEELKQFAVNVGGVVIKGNLANIVNHRGPRSSRCEFGSECTSFEKKQTCNYYHDPEDFLSHGLTPPDAPRNFTVGSWISTRSRSPRTYFTRHLGSKETLDEDLENLRRVQFRDEIANREGQLIHDLLIYMILHQRGLLQRYPNWSTAGAKSS
jgi:hypothetical protein